MLPVVDGFKILQKLGEGGYAEAFLALDKRRNSVVLKLLSPRSRNDSAARKALLREGAMGVRAGRHPNVVRTLGVGKRPEGPYLILEYIEGLSLRQRLVKSPLSEGEVLKLGREIAMGLKHIHERKMLHNDIKPDNIFLAESGACIIDFGLAISQGLLQGLRKRKLDGSPSYVAPERLQGNKPDERADMYSMGITLYEAVTQRTPFSALSTRELVRKHVSESADPLRRVAPDVSMALAHVIDRCIKRNPNDRFNHLNEFLMSLRRHPLYDSNTQFAVDG